MSTATGGTSFMDKDCITMDGYYNIRDELSSMMDNYHNRWMRTTTLWMMLRGKVHETGAISWRWHLTRVEAKFLCPRVLHNALKRFIWIFQTFLISRQFRLCERGD
jgi:hypothetical protein